MHNVGPLNCVFAPKNQHCNNILQHFCHKVSIHGISKLIQNGSSKHRNILLYQFSLCDTLTEGHMTTGSHGKIFSRVSTCRDKDSEVDPLSEMFLLLALFRVFLGLKCYLVLMLYAPLYVCIYYSFNLLIFSLRHEVSFSTETSFRRRTTTIGYRLIHRDTVLPWYEFRKCHISSFLFSEEEKNVQKTNKGMSKERK